MLTRSGVASARRVFRRFGLLSICILKGVASFFILLAVLSFGQPSISLRIGVGRVCGVTLVSSSCSLVISSSSYSSSEEELDM